MSGSRLHLVGGVPLASAEDVFATTSRVLGAALPRIPDGEVGRPWMTWFAPIVEENPLLEKTAEEIRRDLARLPQAGRRPAASPLPPRLTNRVADVVRTRALLQAAAEEKIERIARQLQFPDALVTLSYSFSGSGLVFEVVPLRKNRADPSRDLQREIERKIEALTAEVKPVADAFNRDFAVTSAELNAVREEIDASGFAVPQASAALLSATLQHVVVRENADAYRDYRAAVFEPGLSPEQRRLLFGSAVRDLNLSLPSGELQPIARRR